MQDDDDKFQLVPGTKVLVSDLLTLPGGPKNYEYDSIRKAAEGLVPQTVQSVIVLLLPLLLARRRSQKQRYKTNCI